MLIWIFMLFWIFLWVYFWLVLEMEFGVWSIVGLREKWKVWRRGWEKLGLEFMWIVLFDFFIFFLSYRSFKCLVILFMIFFGLGLMVRIVIVLGGIFVSFVFFIRVVGSLSFFVFVFSLNSFFRFLVLMMIFFCFLWNYVLNYLGFFFWVFIVVVMVLWVIWMVNFFLLSLRFF